MSNSNEIAQIEEINKALTNLNGTLDQTSAKYLSIVKNINDSNASVKISIQTQENLNKAQKDAADTTKQLDSLGKQLEASERKLKETEDSRLQTIIENRIATQEATKAIKDKVIANQVEEGSLVRMRQQLSELTKAYDQSGTRTKAAADEINRLSTEIGKAETATNRHQRAVGGYKEAIGEVGSKFLGFAGMIGIAITLVNQLTEAFKATDIGVRFFSKMSEAAKTFFNNVINGMPGIAVMNSYLATQIAGKLDDLRVEERGEAIRVANLNTDVKLLRLKAATTKDLTVQMDLYRQADAKENESIAIRKEHLTAEIEQLGNMAAVRQKDSALLDKLSQKQVELVELAGDKNIRIQTKLAADQDKLDQQKIKAAEKAAKDRADAIEAENSKQVSMINQSYIDGKISDERYASELTMQEKIYLTSKLALYKQGSKEYMDLIVQMQNLEIKSIEEHNKSKLKLDKDQQNAHDAMEDENLVTIEKNANASIKINKDKIKKLEEEQKKSDDKKLQEDKKMAEAEKKLALEVVNAVFSINKMKLDKQMTDLETQKTAELSNANLTTTQKAAIEAEYAKKEAAIKTKQAIADKEKAIFDIAVNTAAAIMKAAPNVPLEILTAATGAIQLALALAQPIPKFAKGTKSAPSEGIFGEAGRELMFLRSGETALADKPTYFEGSKFKGAQIFSNPETEKMISMRDHAPAVRQMNDERILRSLGNVEKAIKNKPIAIFNDKYQQIGFGNSNHQTIYLNRLMHRN